MSKTYRALVKCGNCSEQKWFEVPTGTLVKDFLRTGEKKCTNCDCLYVPEKDEE